VPTFDEDVVIDQHSLVLQDAGGEEMARLDHDGDLVIRRRSFGSLPEILHFVGASGELTIGQARGGSRPGLAGTIRVLNNSGEAIELRGADSTVQIGGTNSAGSLVVMAGDGLDVGYLEGEHARLTLGNASSSSQGPLSSPGS
jgi:hypothetical protein